MDRDRDEKIDGEISSPPDSTSEPTNENVLIASLKAEFSLRSVLFDQCSCASRSSNEVYCPTHLVLARDLPVAQTDVELDRWLHSLLRDISRCRRLKSLQRKSTIARKQAERHRRRARTISDTAKHQQVSQKIDKELRSAHGAEQEAARLPRDLFIYLRENGLLFWAFQARNRIAGGKVQRKYLKRLHEAYGVLGPQLSIAERVARPRAKTATHDFGFADERSLRSTLYKHRRKLEGLGYPPLFSFGPLIAFEHALRERDALQISSWALAIVAAFAMSVTEAPAKIDERPLHPQPMRAEQVEPPSQPEIAPPVQPIMLKQPSKKIEKQASIVAAKETAPLTEIALSDYELLNRADDLCCGRDAEAALALIDEHHERFGAKSAALRERISIKIMYFGLRKTADAKTRASTFAARFPNDQHHDPSDLLEGPGE